MKKRNYKKLYDVMEITFFLQAVLIVGLVMNFLVIQTNGGLMPVYNYPYDIHTDKHMSFDDWESVNYPIFSDWIEFRNKWYSPGDIIMISSLLLIAILQSYKVYTLFTTREVNE